MTWWQVLLCVPVGLLVLCVVGIAAEIGFDMVLDMVDDITLYRARRKHRKAAKTHVTTPLFKAPPNFFMPFSVCPKCQTEALHWIEMPATYNLADERLMVTLYQDTRQEWVHRERSTWPHGAKLADLITDRVYRKHQVNQGRTLARRWMAANPDVHRRCRECSHSWGQKVQPYTELMGAKTATQRTMF